MVETRLPAWCERRASTLPDGRYIVACYFTRDGHPVDKAHAQRVELIEYAPDGTQLRVREGIVDDGRSEPEPEQEILFTSSNFQFSR